MFSAEALLGEHCAERARREHEEDSREVPELRGHSGVIARGSAGTVRRVGVVVSQDPGQQGQRCTNLIMKRFPLSFAQRASSGER